MTMGQYAINTVGTFMAWGLMGAGIGRRTLFLYGSLCMASTLFIIGGVSLIKSNAASWAVGVLLLCWSVGYQGSIGSLAYAIVVSLWRHLL
jgi:SP family general alpha glucoside:H+ symporter-like MFS transporter